MAACWPPAHLAQLRAEFGKQAQATFQQLAARTEVAQALAHENPDRLDFRPCPRSWRSSAAGSR